MFTGNLAELSAAGCTDAEISAGRRHPEGFVKTGQDEKGRPVDYYIAARSNVQIAGQFGDRE